MNGKGVSKRPWRSTRSDCPLNPNDNQGVCALAVTVLFALKRPEDVIKVCMAYPDDGTPEITYGRALALLQLGRDDEATTALREAVRWRPRVAAELLKTRHRRPQSSIPGYITMGGADEAYEYWQHNGQFWEETEGALSWVAETVRTGFCRKVAFSRILGSVSH
jgi:hypothetical protein